MFKNKVFLGIFALVMGVIFYSFFQSQSGSDADGTHAEKLLKYRKKLDKTIVQGDDSPIQDRSLFKGLRYFEPDSTLIFNAVFTPEAGSATYAMTDSSKANATQVGKLRFEYAGKQHELVLFQEEKLFFLPFFDATNGSETYGGGRYINIEQKTLNGDRLKIDFNYAQNPYCAYNHNYACPIPPKANRLDFAVKAGEKILN